MQPPDVLVIHLCGNDLVKQSGKSLIIGIILALMDDGTSRHTNCVVYYNLQDSLEGRLFPTNLFRGWNKEHKQRSVQGSLQRVGVCDLAQWHTKEST